MKNQKIVRFVSLRLISSFAFVPLMGMGVPAAGMPTNVVNPAPSQIAVAKKLNIQSYGLLSFNQTLSDEEVAEAKVQDQKAKADAIDAYFKARNMPLEGTGMTMVLEAEKNDLDWRLLAAISVRESTGGKQDCIRVPNNPFGWGSCRIGFKTIEDAIATVARNLGGNNPKTAHHYDNKTTLQILRAYNPPSIVPKYGEQVISIMDAIGDPDTSSELAMANS